MFTVASVLSEDVRFTPEVTAAMQAFVHSKPFRGDWNERMAKWTEWHHAMCAAVEVEAGLEFLNVELGVDSLESLQSHIARTESGTTIVLAGKLSVVTYLYLLGALVGYSSHADKMKWAANLFKEYFPRSFARLRTDGPFLTR